MMTTLQQYRIGPTMNVLFLIITLFFIVISAVMILIILVQRPQGGGLVGAFGGAGAGSTETVFGGRVGDALTWATVGAFVLYLGVAISLNKIDSTDVAVAAEPAQDVAPAPTPTPPAGQLPSPTIDFDEQGAPIQMREPAPGEQLPQELIEQLQREPEPQE
jgi:protein translocase SecG subunit